MSLVVRQESRACESVFFILSHPQERQQQKLHHFQHTAGTHLRERRLLGGGGCEKEDVRGFSSTSSFRQKILGTRSASERMLAKWHSGVREHPFRAQRYLQGLSSYRLTLKNYPFLSYFPLSLLFRVYILLPEFFSHFHFFQSCIIPPLLHHPLCLSSFPPHWQITPHTV